MNIDTIRKICGKLPGVTEDIKWGNDLCFLVAEKMFCVSSLDGPTKISFKVKDEEFDTLSNRPGIIPAPYVARYKWILVEKMTVFTKKEWEKYILQSYDLVRSKLPKQIQGKLNRKGS